MGQLNMVLLANLYPGPKRILQIEVHVAQFLVKFYWTAPYVYMVIRSVLTRLLSHACLTYESHALNIIAVHVCMRT